MEDKDLESRSEYDTASEYEMAFESDNEPPSDKVFEMRMIHKTKTLRIYKKILKLGNSSDMPAKCDYITYRKMQTNTEDANYDLLL
jgi:hypothetical protein